jgi:hypothetical protein
MKNNFKVSANAALSGLMILGLTSAGSAQTAATAAKVSQTESYRQLVDADNAGGNTGGVVDGPGAKTDIGGYHYGDLARAYGAHETALAKRIGEGTVLSDNGDGSPSISGSLYRHADTCEGFVACMAAAGEALVAPFVAVPEYLPADFLGTMGIGGPACTAITALWVAVRTPVSFAEGVGKALWSLMP